MKKILFNTLSRQIKELKRTAYHTLYAFLESVENNKYIVSNIDEENYFITDDGERLIFVGAYIDRVENKVKLQGKYSINDKVTYSYSLLEVGEVQLLAIIQYINEQNFTE